MSLLQPSLPKSSKASLFLSLLFKAIKADVNNARVIAFVKRLLQVAVGMQPNFTCGCLMLVSEVAKTKRAIFAAILEPEEKDAGREIFQDIDKVQDPAEVHGEGQVRNGNSWSHDGEDKDEIESEGGEGMLERVTVDGSEDSFDSDTRDSFHKKTLANQPERSGRAVHHVPKPVEGRYDMRKRDPEYSHAECSCLWELNTLAEHYHPSVAAMARSLLTGNPVVYDGDPIREFPLSVFLDRFIQKKPKIAKQNLKGSSLMQPEAVAPTRLTVGSPEFAALAEAEVPPDEVFFHRFFTAKRQAGSERRRSLKKRSSEDSSEESSEEDSDSAESGPELGSDEEEEAWDAAMSASESEEELEDRDADADDVGYDYAQLARMVEGGSDSGESLLDDHVVEDMSDDIALDTSDEEAASSELDQGDDEVTPKVRRQARGDGSNVFASVEDYAHLIGAEGAVDSPSAVVGTGKNKRGRDVHGKNDVRKRGKRSSKQQPQ